jgi:hypothetical protein
MTMHDIPTLARDVLRMSCTTGYLVVTTARIMWTEKFFPDDEFFPNISNLYIKNMLIIFSMCTRT